MKRFILFAFKAYYPEGGAADFKGSFEKKKQAFDHFKKKYRDGYLAGDVRGNVLDTRTLKKYHIDKKGVSVSLSNIEKQRVKKEKLERENNTNAHKAWIEMNNKKQGVVQ